MILLLIAYYFIGRKFYKIEYEISKLIFIIIIGIGLYSISFLFKDINFWLSLGFKALIIVVFPLIILLGGFLEPIEKERVSQIWTKWKSPKNWKGNMKKTNKKY